MAAESVERLKHGTNVTDDRRQTDHATEKCVAIGVIARAARRGALPPPMLRTMPLLVVQQGIEVMECGSESTHFALETNNRRVANDKCLEGDQIVQ